MTIKSDNGHGMSNSQIDEILRVVNENGGAHGNKGNDFQKYWALSHMFKLEAEGVPDFLVLFESLQDVAVLNSATTPSEVKIYQIKKKDRNDWSWNDLTHLTIPQKETSGDKKRKKNSDNLSNIKNSPIGSLYASIIALNGLDGEGFFVSNQPCNLELDDGNNVATSTARHLSKLEKSYLEKLTAGLETLHAAGTLPARPELIKIEAVTIHPDEPDAHVYKRIFDFLEIHHRGHEGQTKSLIRAYMAIIGPLSRQTKTCASFDELRRTRGYSKAEFKDCLNRLQYQPDTLKYIEDMLGELNVTSVLRTKIRMHACKILEKQVCDAIDPSIVGFNKDIDSLLDESILSLPIAEILEYIEVQIATKYPSIRPEKLIAYSLLRVIRKCADQTSED